MSTKKSDLEKIINIVISEDRIRKYIDITDTTLEAARLHQAVIEYNSYIARIIHTLEICIRNIIYDELSNQFDDRNWIFNICDNEYPFFKNSETNLIKAAITRSKKSMYSKLTNQEKKSLDEKIHTKNKSKYAIKKERINLMDPSPGKIISETTLFFWKRLYSKEYEHHLWNRYLKKTFPNKHITRTDVSVHLERIYNTRNRISHNETVFWERNENFISATKFIIKEMKYISDILFINDYIQSNIDKLKQMAKQIEDEYQVKLWSK